MATVVDLITAEAQRQNVDPKLAIEIARAESGLNPNTPDSSAGAIGLFQLEPETAAQLGVDPRDLAGNIRGGVTYIRQMLAQFGNLPTAIAAYNCGPGCISRAIAQWGANFLAHAPTETKNYVAKILRNLAQYTVKVTPESIANGVTQLLAPSPDAATPTGTDSRLEGLLILTALGISVYVVAEVFSND